MSSNFPEKPINLAQVVQGLKDKTLDPKALSPEMREQCIGYFFIHHMSNMQIAQILQISDRTVRRRIKEIKRKWGEEVDDGFVMREVGQMLKKSEFYNMRIFREAQTPGIMPTDRARISYLAWKIDLEKADFLRKMGLLSGKRFLNKVEEINKKEGREEIVGDMSLVRQKEFVELLLNDINRDIETEKTGEKNWKPPKDLCGEPSDE